MQIFCKLMYNVLWHIVLPFWFLTQIPSLLKKPRQTWEAILERLAIYPQTTWQERPVLWFHGSSLGEVVSLQSLILQLQKQYGQSQILTMSTSRGRFIAEEKKVAKVIRYIPLDIWYLVRRAITRLQPQILIVFETEIWPNLFWECQRQKIPVVIVSGRISPRSFPKYHLASFFFAQVLKKTYCLMQSHDDMERIRAIGAVQIQYCGDIKLDGLKTQLTPQDTIFLQNNFSVTKPVVVVGSTHHGEESLVLDVYQKLYTDFATLTLILAPRHLDRMPEIIELLKKKNIPYVCRSQCNITTIQTNSDNADNSDVQISNCGPKTGEPALYAGNCGPKTGEPALYAGNCGPKTIPNNINHQPNKVIILDTYGELSKVYGLADIVIMGGTFVPVGGHNLMEASALAKPVIFGPYISNCRQQAKIILEKNAGQQVIYPHLLYSVLNDWLAHLDTTRKLGERGQQAVLENQGSLARCITQLETILQDSGV